MIDITKVGLLILNDDASKFLVCQKDKSDVTDQYILPGGHFEENSVVACITAEIKEELNCYVDIPSLKYIDDYIDVAAGREDKKVNIKLYSGKIVGTPVPSSEVKNLYWIGKENINDEMLSPIIKNKILPDLIKKGILK